MLQESINQVLAMDDYRPTPAVNEAFGSLVRAVIDAPKSLDFDVESTKRVQQVAAAAETELEVHWARLIQYADNPREAAADFPYFENYAELVRREIHCVEATGHSLTGARVLIIGSGPLPLSAYEYAQQRNAVVDHVDISARAVALCRAISRLLDIPGETLLGDGSKIRLNNRYDAVLIAGLAGETLQDKQAIVDHVLPALADDGRIIVRSAQGSRALLYPAIDADGLRNVTLLSEYHPDDDVINSVFVYKKEII